MSSYTGTLATDKRLSSSPRLIKAATAFMLGLVIAAVAISLRLSLSAHTGGEQVIFSYPAIILATLWFGRPAGVVAALTCFVPLWYYVIPEKHSFAIGSVAAGFTLLIYVAVSVALVCAIGGFRSERQRYRELNRLIEQRVNDKVAELQSFWDQTGELLAILKRNGEVHALNAAFLKALGCPNDDLRGCTFSGLLMPDDRGWFEGAAKRLDLGAGSVSFNARLGLPPACENVAWHVVDGGAFRHLSGRVIVEDQSIGRGEQYL